MGERPDFWIKHVFRRLALKIRLKAGTVRKVFPGYFDAILHLTVREPVWPSGKALGWEAEGHRLDSASVLPSLQKDCGLWTLSCDFLPHN